MSRERAVPDIDSPAFLRAVLGHANDVVVVIDARARLRYVSPSAEWVLGYSPEQFLGTSVLDLVHPDERDSVTDSLGRSIAAGPGSLPMKQLRLAHADGGYRVVELASSNLLDDPAVQGFVISLRDVTARVDAEEAEKAEERRFRIVFEHATDGVSIVGPDGIILYASPSMERVLGYDPAELIGMQGRDLLHPDDVAFAEEAVGEQFATGDWDRVVQYRALHADGTYRIVDAVTTNLLDDEELPGIISTVRDVTERVETERALAEIRERNRVVLQHSFDLISIASLDGGISYISPAVHRILGYDPAELVERPDPDLTLVHPDDLERVVAAIAAPDDPEPTVVRYRARHRDGSERVLEGVTIDLSDEPHIRGFVTNARDVTDRVAAERRVAQLTEVLEKSAEVVVLSEPGGRVVYANQRARASLGIGDEHHVSELSSLQTRERLRTEVMPFVRRHGVWSGELTLQTVDGHEVPVLATIQVHRENNDIVLVSTIAHDITDLKKAQHRLEFEATHDALTSLPNRALFNEQGEQALGRAARYGTTTAVLFIDLDRFKRVNDNLGHDAGDRLLVEAAKRLRVGVRAGDVVARLGGDEFCVLCERVTDVAEIRELAQRLIDAIGSPLQLEGRELEIGASIGIALTEDPTISIGGLIRNADVALYHAKRGGRDQAAVFDPKLPSSSADAFGRES